ncbi:MAG: UDP-3-O-[3-hydroxymyristoyl] N-acetylglucosamine deacetylase [Bacteroidales bacterium]|nr:UDP-3-O-[3-hydroxymyristoyl] N-acetylglucosamine deacetylase [Candidatus Cryptobacteroides aphodequi]
MKQQTLCKNYSFEGKGLHTGKPVHIELCPAPDNFGICFQRTDLEGSALIEAVAANVKHTRRSTELAKGKASVRTVEHILSALTGLGVDNALIRTDSAEMPILDGSARPYVEAIVADGLAEQQEERVWIELDHTVEFRNEKTGSWVRIEPADTLSYECTIDFNSRVLGVQTVKWSYGDDYASQIAPCRTFCFFHEIVKMAALGLVKGGDVENAIVIVEKPVRPAQIARMAKVFHQPLLDVTEKGYLSNLELRFEDECGRHKLLDLMGDLRLCGGFLKAKISAYKPGHSINTKTAKLL